jgi:hypothetical protein
LTHSYKPFENIGRPNIEESKLIQPTFQDANLPVASFRNRPRPLYEARRPGGTPIWFPTYPAKVDVDASLLPEFDVRSFPGPNSGPRITLTPRPTPFADAIASAEPGSILVIPAGRYVDSFEVTKSLTFIANVHVSLFNDDKRATVTINAPCVHFEGVSIKHKGHSARSAIAVQAGALQLTNCKVRSTSVASLFIKGAVTVKLCDCKIRADHGLPALNVLAGGHVIAERTSFSDTRNVAVILRGDSVPSFTQCRFEDAQKGGVAAFDQSRVRLDSCEFLGCQIELAGSAGIVAGTIVGRTEGAGITCATNTSADLVSNQVHGCYIDARDGSNVRLISNMIDDGWLIVWGRSKPSSNDDTFKGTAEAAIAV